MGDSGSDSAERPDPPEGSRSTLSRFTMPADDWARDDAARGPRTVDALMLTSIAALTVAAIAAIAWHRGGEDRDAALVVMLGALAVAALLEVVAMHRVRRDLHAPLSELYAWALGMCSGDFSTRVPADGEDAYRKLAFHINRLSEALERLANEMDDVVWRQTQRLREKNASLELLYEVAASIHRLDSVDEILRVSAQSLMRMVKARGVMVCLRDPAGEMSVALSIGQCPDRFHPDEDTDAKHSNVSLSTRAALAGDRAYGPSEACAASGASPTASDEPGVEVSWNAAVAIDADTVTVPLNHKDVRLGVIRLFTESCRLVDSDERQRLLLSVGRHLGMSIAKARTDDESKMLSIVRERSAIAYELHDSLAQTLASLRLQADMLAESLARTGAGHVPPELARMQTTLECANIELRELIAGFRAPVGGRDLRTALEEVVARYSSQSALTVCLQIDGSLPELPAGPQLQVVRIVGEALANACAHSAGSLARVLVRCESATVRVLVEDDGKGFSIPRSDSTTGEHIGLSVMRERARWLGGTLVIESEPGEGTRVSLAFPTALHG